MSQHKQRRTTSVATATKRFPIEVRYSNLEHTSWTLYSRHRSKAAAERAFAEACNAMPDQWVQMRNDIEGAGLIHDRWRVSKHDWV